MKASLLCSPDYLPEARTLPYSRPPRWMAITSVIAVGWALVMLVITLLGPMDEYVLAPGEVRPAHYRFVFSPVGGVIKDILVEDGQMVKKGQILARFDPWEAEKQIVAIRNELAEAEAEGEMAEANTKKVAAVPVPTEFLFSPLDLQRQKEIVSVQQDHLKRLEELERTGASSPVEILNLKLQLITAESLLKRNQQASTLMSGDFGKASQNEADKKQKFIEARVKGLRDRLGLAETDLKRLEIVAPEDGAVVGTTRRFPGEKVEQGSALFKISDMQAEEVRLYASEDRVHLIKPGQLVRFRARSNADKLAPPAIGRIDEVALDRDMEEGTPVREQERTYRIKVKLESSPYPLPLGATVDAEIVLQSRPFYQVLLLRPTAAVGKKL